MLIAQRETAIASFHAHTFKSAIQHQCILDFIRHAGGDWSIGELAHAMRLQKSTIAARLNELLYETKQLVEATHRKDRISNVMVRPVAFPMGGQRELF